MHRLAGAVALAKAVALPDVIACFASVGLEPVPDTRPEAQLEQMHHDLIKYTRVVKLAGINVE